MKKHFHLFLALLLTSAVATAQRTVSGKVSEKNGSPLIGVSVVAKGTTDGAVTDNDGKFSFAPPAAATVLELSFIGYGTVEVSIPASNTVNVVLESTESNLSEVVISTGGRSSQRTIADSPVPIDVLSAGDLATTGQISLDKQLMYRVPSFNTVNTPVNDATTLLDPYEIRNLGPSRTLILVNGKRKNLSSLLYVQFSPGRGETGVDLSAIPTDAIKRIEILRDGASAQYGSDAIAGVMNVILKDKYEYSSLNINSGITSAGDGGTLGVSFNGGANFAEKGFVNYTIGVKNAESAVRSGIIDVSTEQATFGTGDGKAADDIAIKTYLGRFPNANNINGTGATSAASFDINAGIPISESGLLYANGAFVAKKVNSFANYRPNYWKPDYGLLHAAGTEYIGYVPTFEGDLTDYNATVGIKDERDGWKTDVSLTTGGNQQLYTVNNTVNHTLQAKSPTSFKTGGFNFSHIVGNLDVSKTVVEGLNVSFGVEARQETFKIIAGDTASYSGQGSNSFPGINVINATTNSRFNLGGYAGASYDFTKTFLIDATVRTEKYSDFGNATVGKISSRLKLADDKIVLRGSYSTGFRAPSLHQIYDQSIQANFSGGTIALSGLFNNGSVQAKLLSIPALRPEKSTNISVGATFSPTKDFSLSLDYYAINITDRIVYSSSISADANDKTSVLSKILSGAGIKTIQFFINGIETNTNGLDYVASYKNIAIGSGKLMVNLAGNFTLVNEIVGAPQEPAPIAAVNKSILNPQIRSLLTESRPKYKSILGLDYNIGAWSFNLTNTLFGTTKFQDLDNGLNYPYGDPDNSKNAMFHIKQEFSPAVVTDLGIGYALSKKLGVGVTVNNLFNILPSWKLVSQDALGSTILGDSKVLLNNSTFKDIQEGALEFSGRYRILGYNGSQFSQLGTVFNANLNFKF